MTRGIGLLHDGGRPELATFLRICSEPSLATRDGAEKPEDPRANGEARCRIRHVATGCVVSRSCVAQDLLRRPSS